ncbi:MAG: ABC transporter substrate-binding protein [Spirochaetia bacterium]
MNRGIRYLLVALFAIAAGGLAFGSGGGEQGAVTGKTPVTLTWYYVGGGPQKDNALIEAAASKYVQSKGLNANIKLVCFDWGTYNQKLQTIIAGQEEFDICFTATWINNYRNNVARGAFLPLNDLLAKYAPKTKALLGDSFLAGSTIEGVNYAIPANKEKAHNWGFLLRKDLVAKYNMDTTKIKKLEDLEPLLKIIKDKEPGIYPLEAIVGESPRFLLDWDKMVDDDIPVSLYPNNSSTKVVFELEAPETKALFTTMHKFYNAGYVRKDAAAITDYLADEKAGLIFAATKSLKPGKDAEMASSTGQQWMQIDITPPVMSNRETVGSLQAISHTSKNPAAAVAFLELFNTDKYLNNLINYGIEGTHYVKVSDNMIKAGPSVDQYNLGMQWMFGNQFLNYLYSNEDPKKWDKFNAYNKAALPLKSLGFSFDPAPVKTEVATAKGVWTEFMPALETGTVDPEKGLADAIAKYKAVGIDRIMAEVQKQYDAWLAKKK